MTSREQLIEQTSAEIINAAADGDNERASKLAALQRELIARVLRDSAAEPIAPVQRAGDMQLLR